MREANINDLLTPRNTESAVDIVISTIKDLLITRKLLPGDKLPNETELAKRLGVSRGIIREAMKMFHAFGIVEIKQGAGTYISKTFGRVLFDPLMFSMILVQPDIEELAEFRRIMEIDVVNLVIQNATPEDIHEIEEVYNRMERLVESNNDVKDLAKLDVAFHKALGKATKNRLIERTYSFIMDFFEPSIEHTLENQERGMYALSSHKMILDAITGKKIDKAKEAIEASVVVWRQLSRP